MSGKVLVSKEVAEFLESNNDGNPYWEDSLLEQHTLAYINGFKGVKEEAECMKKFTPMVLAKILINGYEVEETPEDLILKEYNRLKNLRIDDSSDGVIKNECIAGMHAMVYTLNTLNIQVKGINA